MICMRCSLAEVINGDLWNDEAKAHRQDDKEGGRAVSDCRAYKVERGMWSVSDLHEAARHPEEVDARYHRHHGGEANSRKRHVPTACDGCEDQANNKTSDEGAGREAGAEQR